MTSKPDRLERERAPRDPSEEEGALLRLLLRLGALGAFFGLCVAVSYQLPAFRAALAQTRFQLARRAADETWQPEHFVNEVKHATADINLMIRHGEADPRGLIEASVASLDWALDERLPSAAFRVQLAENAVRAAAAAVLAAPSDFFMWRELARSQIALDLDGGALASLDMAQRLAPPGLDVSIGEFRPTVAPRDPDAPQLPPR